MGETLEAVKKHLGLDSNPAANKEGDKTDPFGELQKAISLVQNSQARDLLQSQADALKADFDLRTAKAQEEIRQLKSRGAATGSQVDEKAKVKQEIVAQAVLLLEGGVSPDVVGQYLVGSGTPAVPINLGGGGGQGITMADVMSILSWAEGKKGTSSELEKILEKLTDKVAALERGENKQPPPPSVTWLYRKGKLEKIEGGAPVVIEEEATTPSISGEPLNVVQEKNRHEEKMEEIKGNKEYHEKITDIAGSAFENIGRGLASQVMEDAGAEGAVESGKLEYFICPEPNCGTKIPITPETQQITCPKCKGIYTKKTETPEEK